MGGRLATYENSGKVFLRGFVSSYGGRSYPALQKLDSSPLLPGAYSGTYSRYRNVFNDWIQRGLLRNWLRPTRSKDRPVGR
jgi:hypothetical protein